MDTKDQIAKLKEEAATHDREAFESFERCDTDGFLSQWASGINAQEARLKASLIEQGGTILTIGPVTEDGSPTTHRRVETRYGFRYIVLPDGEPDGEVVQWLTADPVHLATVRKHGYTLGVYKTEATVRVVGRDVMAVRPVIVPKETTLTPDNSELLAIVEEGATKVAEAYELRAALEEEEQA